MRSDLACILFSQCQSTTLVDIMSAPCTLTTRPKSAAISSKQASASSRTTVASLTVIPSWEIWRTHYLLSLVKSFYTALLTWNSYQTMVIFRSFHLSNEQTEQLPATMIKTLLEFSTMPSSNKTCRPILWTRNKSTCSSLCSHLSSPTTSRCTLVACSRHSLRLIPSKIIWCSKVSPSESHSKTSRHPASIRIWARVTSLVPWPSTCPWQWRPSSPRTSSL